MKEVTAQHLSDSEHEWVMVCGERVLFEGRKAIVVVWACPCGAFKETRRESS